jgi:hypothetical protein
MAKINTISILRERCHPLTPWVMSDLFNLVLEKEELEQDNTAALIWEAIEITKSLKINPD